MGCENAKKIVGGGGGVRSGWIWTKELKFL